eukprot:6210131-Pleurochrysis_carterae.AAC.3
MFLNDADDILTGVELSLTKLTPRRYVVSGQNSNVGIRALQTELKREEDEAHKLQLEMQKIVKCACQLPLSGPCSIRRKMCGSHQIRKVPLKPFYSILSVWLRVCGPVSMMCQMSTVGHSMPARVDCP